MLGTRRTWLRSLKVAAAAVLALAPFAFAQAQPTKVGFVYVSPIGDAG